MLSVIIETHNSEEALACTLASLVPGAVEGAVREVIVCDRGSTDQTHRVADHAGCTFVANGGIAAAIRQARSEWLLLLEPGAKLSDGWMEEVGAHVARQTMAARFSRSRGSRPSFIARVFSARRALADGLVITRRQALSLSRAAKDAEALARGLSVKRLPAEIVVAASA